MSERLRSADATVSRTPFDAVPEPRAHSWHHIPGGARPIYLDGTNVQVFADVGSRPPQAIELHLDGVVRGVCVTRGDDNEGLVLPGREGVAKRICGWV